MNETPSDLQVAPSLGVAGDIQVLGPEHAECVAGYRLLREELVRRTTERDAARAEADGFAEDREILICERDEARAEVIRLSQELERLPTAMVVSGTPESDESAPIDMGWMSLPQDLQDAAVAASKAPSPVPRVWKKGDPEPPEDVVLLRNIGDQADGLPYLRRHDGGWCWVMEATDGPDVNRWPWRLLIAGPVLTEVVQDGSNPDGGADGCDPSGDGTDKRGGLTNVT